MAEPAVALVLVSHSAQLAEGVRELALQMAPGVSFHLAGGLPDGSLGTDFEAVDAALRAGAASPGGAVVLTDLGSAVLTVEAALELADEAVRARVHLADAPLVEGAVAAAVAAHGGGSATEVLDAAEHAGSTFADRAGRTLAVRGWEPGTDEEDAVVTIAREVVVPNPMGLHARPAAILARMVARLDAAVRIDGVNAASVLELMKLGVVGGASVRVEAEGPAASEAVAAVVEAIEGGFGEV